MKLDREPLAVRETAARIYAPDPAHAGRRALAAALRGAVRLPQHSSAHPHEQPCGQRPYGHPHTRPCGESEVG
ncbi:hypothetical protein [Streptomyces sennicomposti]